MTASRRRISALSAAAIAATLLLAGCAGAAPAETQTSAPTATETLTAEPTPTPTATPASMQLPFDGDCNSVFTAEQLNELVGEAELDEPWGADLPPEETLGLLSCRWNGELSTLEAIVAPADSVVDFPLDRYVMSDCGSAGYYYCGAVGGDSETWILVATLISSDSAADLQRANTALGYVEAASHNYPQPVALKTEKDWWSLPSCDELDSRLDMAAILGRTASEPVYHSDNIPSGPTWDLLEGAGRTQWCPWTVSDGSPYDTESKVVEIEIWPGAADTDAMQKLIAIEGIEPIDVAGADSAYIGPGLAYSGTYTSLYVIDGPNVMQVYGLDGDSAGLSAVATAVLEQLQ
ncbi:hypothetical protein FHX48_001577 [Microbacterium halimionae]|uniref:DUF3558 domain-containing protein n=1 Tax=Microbacterium halimionae TaxID=1526413 RepID=A0A7W3JP95_9MICO|nr:hypothetical protein [Microbacterium halimionae]MBA8816504.1 hypothetical protein [Microbacterium halimionae]NII95309.1 hypothetical protein [Microbacterium halimionae]